MSLFLCALSTEWSEIRSSSDFLLQECRRSQKEELKTDGWWAEMQEGRNEQVSISIVSIVLFVSRNILSANHALTGLQIVSFCISISVNHSIHPGDPAG